ncbi:MAG: hypothetical protein JOZ15_09055 [Acidobacteria bacterium]|nr:hypothetical protein [Acidobacteriota bacterium]
MSAARQPAAPLRFRGAPLGLAAVVATADSSHQLTLELSAKAAAQPAGRAGLRGVVLSAAATEGARILRLDLPRATPPGTYEGILKLADLERPVVVEVEPDVQLRLVPPRLTLQAAPGDRVASDLTLLNVGNVGATIRKAYAFGLFAVGGAERAIRSGFAGDLGEGQRRIDRIADAAADEHGGMVRVKVREGAGDVAPGGTRQLSIELAIPERLRADSTYWGTWALFNLRYYVRITTAAGASSKGERP